MLYDHQTNFTYDNFTKVYLSQLQLYSSGVNFECVLNTLSLKEFAENGDDIYDFNKLDSLLDLKFNWLKNAMKLEIANDEQDDKERFILKTTITDLNTKAIFNNYQQNVVHNWNVLVQLIVTDGVLTADDKNKFILSTFESLIGEVELLIDSNIKYAEEFISLIVLLYDILGDMNYNVYDKNLYKLFMTSVQGISSPLTSVSMRSDLYVLMNKYLTSLMTVNEKNNEVNNASIEVSIHPTLKKLIHDLKMLDEKLIEIMVLDCINGSCQSPERITSVLFLKSLVKLGNFVSGNKSNFIIKALSNSNMLTNLICSIKNLDEMVHNDSDATLSFEDVKYELTVFKFTMSVLTDIAATRLGAYELLQNDAMSVINKLRFESLDLNLGTDLEFKEFITLNQTLSGKVRIKLDNNVPSPSSSKKTAADSNVISVFEILIPIFKFTVTISGSLGFENKQLKLSISKFLSKYDQQIKNLLKRDSLMVENKDKSIDNGTYSTDLQTLIKLIIVLYNEMREY